MTQRPVTIPSWTPLAAAAAILLWAVGIWWMVATLPAAAQATDGTDEATALRVDIGLLTLNLETLTAERDQLTEERDALRLRVTELEAALAAATVPADAGLTGSDAGTADEEDITQHPLYTNGADRYNCRNFASFEEAQEALRVNRPGDPNRIDMNRNGIACEDIRYPAPASTPTTPTPATAP